MTKFSRQSWDPAKISGKTQDKFKIQIPKQKSWNLLFVLILSFVLCYLTLDITVCFSKDYKPRYISLAPSTTEILFTLDLDEEIIGVSQSCNYPPEALNKEKIGTFSHPNIEKIVALNPDIIFCTGLEQAPIVTKLRQLKYKVYVSDPSSLEELLNSISEIGRLVNREGQAIALVEKMRKKIEAINFRVKTIPQNKRPKVFIEIWHDPLMTAGKGTYIDELFTLAGGINIAFDTKRPYSIFSSEQVIKRNPDCIILAYMNKDSPFNIIGARFGWHNLSAVKNNCLYNDINPDLFLRPGPRVVEALEEIYKRLYPK